MFTDGIDTQHAQESKLGNGLVSRSTEHNVDSFSNVLLDSNLQGNLFGKLTEAEVVRVIKSRKARPESEGFITLQFIRGDYLITSVFVLPLIVASGERTISSETLHVDMIL